MGPWGGVVDPRGRGEAVPGNRLRASARGIVAAEAMPEYVIERDVPARDS